MMMIIIILNIILIIFGLYTYMNSHTMALLLQYYDDAYSFI